MSTGKTQDSGQCATHWHLSIGLDYSKKSSLTTILSKYSACRPSNRKTPTIVIYKRKKLEDKSYKWVIRSHDKCLNLILIPEKYKPCRKNIGHCEILVEHYNKFKNNFFSHIFHNY